MYVGMNKNEAEEVAVFGGGCFWCTEAVFKRLKGVTNVISGYAGGKEKEPSYQQVSSGATGHAEAVQISFDPKVISYDTLLDVFWATHDPTTKNRQGADVGTEYRSVIFYLNEYQKMHALSSKEKLEQKKEYPSPIVTQITPLDAFYKAEDYHQNYYEENRNKPYCALVINPKIQKLLNAFTDNVKEEYKSL